MANLTLDDMRPAMDYFADRIRQLKADSPHLFEPIQIIVEKDDGTEVDLCDVSRPLDELMVEVIDER